MIHEVIVRCPDGPCDHDALRTALGGQLERPLHLFVDDTQGWVITDHRLECLAVLTEPSTDDRPDGCPLFLTKRTLFLADLV
jgi:hypothetical protein